MGFFDLAAPLLSRADGLLGSSAPWLHVALWGAVSGAVSMALYRAVSCQPCIARVKAALQPVRSALAGYDGDARGLMELVVTNLRLSLKQVGLTAYPAILASLPILFVLAWMSNDYSYGFPNPGAEVTVKIHSSDPHLEGQTIFRWPANRRVTIDWKGRDLVQVFFAKPVPVIHKHAWWNLLFGNPNGYLPHDSPVDRLDFDFPPKTILPLGPDWMRGWIFLYFTVMVVVSLAVKIVFRIH